MRLLAGLAVLLLAGSPATHDVTDLPDLHDLHVTYGDLGVEGSVAVLRVRVFKDDLEGALAAHAGRPSVTMEADPVTDALFLAYLRDHYAMEVGGRTLTGRILESGEDSLDREPVWWYAVRFDAPEPIRAGRIRNTLLFERFGDQRNLVKLVHFPDETSRTFYFGHGEEWVDFDFGEGAAP
ncbi:MAG TPA: DUF6702 family protein [Longimicrobiales bacterium]|jgi:hypothetical protein